MHQTDEDLRTLLSEARTIAVVGMKDRESEDAYRIPLYMQEHGYKIVPVNPALDSVLGERAFPTLADIDIPIDLVDLFRAADHIPGHADEILAMNPRPATAWMQLGISHGRAARRLHEAGIAVVEDLCIMMEHRRLLGGQ